MPSAKEPSASDQYSAKTVHQPADPLRYRLLLQRAVRDAEVAAVGEAKCDAGNHRDAVLANQPLGKLHRIRVGVDAYEAVERAVGRRHGTQRLERPQLGGD